MQLYERKDWGAKYRNGVGTRKVGKLDKIAHHTVTKHLAETATFAAECTQMRSIEAIGQQRFGAGISYSAVIFPSGRVYLGVDPDRISYHTGSGHNTTGFAICWAGNYETGKATQTQIIATAELLQHGVKQGWWTVPKIEYLHRQIKSTTCPGNNYANAVPEINRLAAGSTISSTPTASKPVDKTAYPAKTAGIDPQYKISDVQTYLQAAGYYDRVIDNKAGDYTYSAIYRYQQSQKYFPGLIADAYWGSLTHAHYLWVKKMQTALNKWKSVRRIGLTLIDGDYGSYADTLVRAVIKDNFNGAYKQAVQAIYGSSAVPVNDGKPGQAFCKMLDIPTHPMEK